MYSTSQAYKTAMRAASRPYNTVYGTLTFTDTTTLTIDSSILPENSMSISKQCIDDNALMFGGVFASTLKISLMPEEEIDRYAYYGATIDLKFKVQVGSHTVGTSVIPDYEEVPLGIFTVADADKPSTQVNLTCYDNMLLLDTQLGANYLTGTVWEMFQLVSQYTGMELGFDEEDLEDFVNTSSQYQVSASSDRGLQTYRDVVKMLCQQMGCFAYADRTGRLALKEFSVRPDLSLTMSNWYSFVPADYECKYIGLSVTSLAGVFSELDETAGQGLIMIVEDAPAWDYGSQENLQARTTNLFTYLMSIDEYTPCQLDMPSDPSFDCGDRLSLTARNGDVVETLITSMEWKWHQGMSIDSEGLNPYLEGGTALAQESARLLNQAVAKSKLQFLSFTNSRNITVSSTTPVLVGECTFTPTSETSAVFIATLLTEISDVPDISETDTEEVTVPVKAYYNEQETTVTDINGNPVSLTGVAENTYTFERDGKCEVDIFYTLNGVRLPSNEYPYTAIEELPNGKHIITLSYPITSLVAYERYEFQVWITSDGGTTVLPANTVRATLVGQELTDTTQFDGRLKVDDEMSTLVTLEKLGIVTITDDAEITFVEAAYASVSDDISLYNNVIVDGIALQEGTSELAPHIFLMGGKYLSTDDGKDLMTDGGDWLITDLGDNT